MSERAEQLHITADTQIGELVELISTSGRAALRRPCPGREKLGDGTIGAIAAQTAQNYQRIGAFVAASQRMSSGHDRGHWGRSRTPGLLRALSHTPPDHRRDGPDGHGQHDGYAAAAAEPIRIVEAVAGARENLSRIARLTDQQLDAIPPKDSFRFCDGQRTLEQVLAGLLKHQDHQVKTIEAALARTP